MNRFLKIMIVTLLAVAGLSVCVRAAMRIADRTGVFALRMAEFAGSVKSSGKIVTHNIGELHFRGIEAATAAKVKVRSADDPGRDVILRVNEDMAELVELKVRKGILKISLKSDTYSFKKLNSMTFEVSVPHCDELSSLEAVAGAEIDVSSPLTAGKVSIEAVGASKIEVPLDCAECESEATGASKIRLKGRCEKLSAEAVGVSKIDASECESLTCDTEAVGASSIKVWCTEQLTVEAVGASKVAYRGNCEISASTTGASRITKIE